MHALIGDFLSYIGSLSKGVCFVLVCPLARIGSTFGGQGVVCSARIGFKAGTTIQHAADVKVGAGHVQNPVVAHGQRKAHFVRVGGFLAVDGHEAQRQSLRPVCGYIVGGSHGGVSELVPQAEVGIGGTGELHQARAQVLRGVLPGDVHVRPLRHHRGGGHLASGALGGDVSLGSLA